MRALLPVLFALGASSGIAQVPPRTSVSVPEQYNFTLRHYTVVDGLPSRQVTSLAQDDQDFIWMASPMGLVRFDGYRFVNHDQQDGLSGNAVRTVLRDADGMLWIQFEDGEVDIMDPARRLVVPFKHYFAAYPNASIHAPIHGMAASATGTIVFGQGRALVRYRGVQWGFERKAVACNGPLNPLVVEENDDVWCECASGYVHTSTRELLFLRSASFALEGSPVVRWQGIAMGPGKGIDRYAKRPMVPQGAYVTLLRSGLSSTGWVRPDGAQLLHPPTEQGTFDRPRFNHRTPLTQGIWLVDGKVRRMQAGDAPLNAPVLFDLTDVDIDVDQELISVLRDRAGNIWIANDHGLFKLTMKSDPFRRFLYQPRMPGSFGARIRGMMEIAGKLHVNTDVNGYYVLDARSGEVLGRDARTTFRLGMTGDASGGLWRAEYGDLVHDGPDGTTDAKVHAHPWATPVWSIIVTTRGTLLMGSESGLRIADPPDSARALIHPGHPELDRAVVWHLGRSTAGSILACTNQGLYQLDEEGMVLHRWWFGAERAGDPLHDLPTNDIRHFHQDPDGHFWLSTATAGLLHWDRERGTVRTFGQRQGIPVTSLHAVYGDAQGTLWIPSDNGLIRFVPSTGKVKIFTTVDGVAHNEFNRIAHHRSQAGIFYFGGLNGITVFDPTQLQPEPGALAAPLVLLAVDLMHDSAHSSDHTLSILGGAPITMDQTTRFFTVDMALLSYDDPKEIRYAWRIDGIDDDWNYQIDPHLRFTALPYGDHLLRIKALDREGRWSANELGIAITMMRPMYLRWWFIALCVITVLVAAYALVQYRIRQLSKVIRVRDRIALDLHDEVGSNLSSIVLFSTAVGTHAHALPPKAANMLKRITENSTRAMESMNDIVWSVSSSNDQIEDLVDRMRAFAQPLCEAANVQLDFTIGDGILARKPGMEERKNIYLIFKEALNNAVKHAQCSRIEVSLTLSEAKFRLVVSDNGTSAATHYLGNVSLGGNGLGNMRRRALEVGGTMEIQRGTNGGTQVVFCVSANMG